MNYLKKISDEKEGKCAIQLPHRRFYTRTLFYEQIRNFTIDSIFNSLVLVMLYLGNEEGKVEDPTSSVPQQKAEENDRVEETKTVYPPRTQISDLTRGKKYFSPQIGQLKGHKKIPPLIKKQGE